MRRLPAAVLTLVLAGCGGSGGNDFVVGAVDDAVRTPGPALGLLADAGFGAVGITSFWEPGLAAPTAAELATLRDVAARARERDLRVFLAVYHRGSATTPLTAEARTRFAAFVAAIVRETDGIDDVIVGNEPNLNRFWLPQFGPDGEDVAAPAYLELLHATYEAVKAADEDVTVWGGALAPRGVDRPGTGRDTQSPTTFLRDLGAAFRAAGWERPPLDGFAFHPYPESARVPTDRPHPRTKAIGLADHTKLRRLLDDAFGPGLPILYSELGVESAIPPARHDLYTGEEVAGPVDERTQADYYRRAIQLSACQEGVAGLLLFHSQDEPALEGFQSGVRYADGTPKSGLEPVRAAIERAGDEC